MIKHLLNWKDIYLYNLLVLKGCWYFIGYKDDEKVKPLCIMLPKMSGSTKNFDETKCLYFLIQHDDLLEK